MFDAAWLALVALILAADFTAGVSRRTAVDHLATPTLTAESKGLKAAS